MFFPLLKFLLMPAYEYTIVASINNVNLNTGNNAINAGFFNGAIPGTRYDLVVGDTMIVKLINDLHQPVGIHWHGIELENYSDGKEVTQSEVVGSPAQLINGIPSGGTFLYKFNVPKARGYME